MKTKRLLFICCLLGAAFTQISFSQWAHVTGPTGDVQYLNATGSNIVAQTNSGFFVSTDNGLHWTQADPGLADSLVSTFPADSANFLVGNIFGQLPPLPNGLNLQTASIEVSAFLSLVTGMSILYPQTNIDSVLVSLDTGSTALKISQIMSRLALYAAGLDTTDILAKIEMAKMMISIDGGNAWIPIQAIMSGISIRALEKTDNFVFVGTNKGVFRATINGTDWSPVNIGLANKNVHALASIGTVLFAATDGGVFLTRDNGITWIPVNSGLTTTKVLALVATGNTLFAGTQGGGAFLTLNYGTSWRAINQGLTSLIVNTLAMGNNTLFAGTQAGVFAATLKWLLPPLPPQGLVVTDSSSATIKIKWQKNTEADFLRYRIYRGTSPNPTSKVDSTTAGLADTSKTFTGLVNGTRYYLRVTAVDSAGNESMYSNEVNAAPHGVVGVEGIPSLAPKEYSLSQNYPNPFNPSTIIEFDIAVPGRVSVRLYDGLGRLVRNLVDEVKEAGHYQFQLNAADLPSGAYYYRLTAGKFTETRKLMLVQ